MFFTTVLVGSPLGCGVFRDVVVCLIPTLMADGSTVGGFKVWGSGAYGYGTTALTWFTTSVLDSGRVIRSGRLVQDVTRRVSFSIYPELSTEGSIPGQDLDA